MKITQIINSVFRQDFSDKAVLGRTLLGFGILCMGLLNLSSIAKYASYAPSFIPFKAFFVVLVGALFVIFGFLIIGNMHMQLATKGLIVLLGLFIIGVFLPEQRFDVLLMTLSVFGATLMMFAQDNKEGEVNQEKEKTPT